MKWDVFIIRLAFVAMLAAVGYLLNPLAQTSHLDGGREMRQLTSAVVGALVALLIIAFEMRARQASLRTLIGAAIGSIMGIVGAYLIGMLISAQDINTVPGEMRTFLTIVLACFMGYIGLMVGAAKGDYLDLSALGGIFSDKSVKRDYKILDTSVIIDGRIADVSETGFLGGTLIMPNFSRWPIRPIRQNASGDGAGWICSSGFAITASLMYRSLKRIFRRSKR